jgi:hypothetical protein
MHAWYACIMCMACIVWLDWSGKWPLGTTLRIVRLHGLAFKPQAKHRLGNHVRNILNITPHAALTLKVSPSPYYLIG